MERPAPPGPVSGVSGVSQVPPEVRAKTAHELLLIIAKHLEENDLASVAHHLTKKARLYICVDYLTKLVLAGKWHKVEKYLQAFYALTFSAEDQQSSNLLFFIRKQRFLHLLHRGETLACVEMLRKDFAPMRDQIDADRLKELDAAIVHADPFSMDSLRGYTLDEAHKQTLLRDLIALLEQHPQLSHFLAKPVIVQRRLRQLINQRHSTVLATTSSLYVLTRVEYSSLNYQHDTYCKPRLPKDRKTQIQSTSLLTDHRCDGLLELPTSPPLSPVPSLPVLNSVPPPTIPSLTTPPVSTGPIQPSKNESEPPRKMQKKEAAPTATPTASSSTSAPLPTVSVPTKILQSNHEMLQMHLLNEWAIIDTKSEAKVSAIALRPPTADGTRSILLGLGSGELRLYEIKPTGKPRQRAVQLLSIQDHSNGSAVTALAWANATQFAVGYKSGELYLYNYDGEKTAKQLHALVGHSDYIFRVLFSPYYPGMLFSCSKDAQIIMWNAQTGAPVKTYRCDGPVFGIWPALVDSRKYLMATGKMGIKCFVGGNSISLKELPDRKYCTDVRVIGSRVFSCSPLMDCIIEWHEQSNEYMPFRFKGYQGPEKDGPMPRLEVIMDSFLAVASKAGVHLWDLNNTNATVQSNLIPSDDLIKGGIGGIAYDSGLLGVYSRSKSAVAIYGPNPASISSAKRPLERDEQSTSSAQSTPGGLPAVTSQASIAASPQLTPAASATPTVPHTIATQPRSLSTLVNVNSPVLHARYTMKGTELITISGDNFVRVWQFSPQGSRPAYEAQYPNDEKKTHLLALTANESFALTLVGTKFTVTEVRQSKAQRMAIDVVAGHTALASCPDDNNVLALGRSGGVVNIFSVRTMKQPTCTLNLEGSVAVASLAFAPDQHIVVTDNEGRIFFASWKESASRLLSEYFTLPNHTPTPVYAVLNKARDVAVLYSATKIGLYHLPTKTWRAVLSIPDGKQISAVAYAANESLIACALVEQTLLALNPETLAIGAAHTLPERIFCIAAEPNTDQATFIAGSGSGKVYHLIL